MPEQRKRHFPDFIKAYEEYVEDNFVPKVFDTWTAISLVAAALERKVWLQWSPTFEYYPNVYVLLVSMPGVGKSTALNRGVKLLKEMSKKLHGKVNFLPAQITEAKLIEELARSRQMFPYGNMLIPQCSNYYVASEASNGLKEVYGDFLANLTEFYDCPEYWERATKKDGNVRVENACFNIIAGCTFDHLAKMVNDSNIQGGLASRFTYVLSRDTITDNFVFQPGENEEAISKAHMRPKLLEDLRDIHDMVGPMWGHPDAGKKWAVWRARAEKKRLAMKSEKMQSLLVRQNTLVIKLMMILAAAKGRMELLMEDLDEAIALAEGAGRELPDIFREAKAADTRSQDGLNQALFHILAKADDNMVPRMELETKLMLKGFDPKKIDFFVQKAIQGDVVDLDLRDRKEVLILRADPNHYL